jgi:hypothetical protein
MAVINRAAVDVCGELLQQVHPCVLSRSPGRLAGHGVNSDHSFNDFDGAAARRGGPGLLPRPVPARCGAPLRNRPTRPRCDRPKAPPACRGCCPASCTARVDFPRLRVQQLALRSCGPLLPLPTTTLAVPLHRAVLTAGFPAHGSSVRGDVHEPVTTNCVRPGCMRCVLLDLVSSPAGAAAVGRSGGGGGLGFERALEQRGERGRVRRRAVGPDCCRDSNRFESTATARRQRVRAARGAAATRMPDRCSARLLSDGGAVSLGR